jgi:subtilisin family serine protease
VTPRSSDIVIGMMRRRKHALFFFVLWGVVSLSGMEVAPDLVKIDPAALATDQPAIVAHQGRIMGAAGRQPAAIPVFVHLQFGNRVLPGKIRSLGGEAEAVHERLYTGSIPRDAARYISRWPEVSYIEAGRRAYPLLDFSGPAISADTVHQGSPAWPSPFDVDGVTGAGTFVAVVDSGLSGAHPDFHTGAPGSPLRVLHTYASPQLPPSQSDPLTDEDGHGTHVTGIATGNGFASSGTFTGIAPEADILYGKTSFFTTDIVNAVSDLITYAENNNTPVAVNLSLGAVVGPHDGTSGFESGIDSLGAGPAGSRRIIVASAGNERENKEHFHATIPPFGLTTATVTFADLGSTTVEIWADGDDEYTVTATMGSETVAVPAGASGSSGGRRITVSNEVSLPPNGATVISVFFLPVTGGGTGTIQLRRTRNGGTGTVDAYVDGFDGSLSADAENGTITEPANGKNVLAVGSYDTKTFAGDPSPEEISSFSSLGPTRDGRTKPDLTAPGSVLYSARSFEASYSQIEIVTANDNYVIKQGTSMAAPHVTGTAALVWQTNPALTGTQMRERLRKTVDPPTDGSQTPNNTWGTGKVNTLQAVTWSVASITAPASSLPGTPVSLTSENSSGAFGSPLTTYSWVLTPPAGSGASLSTPTAASDSFTPDVPGDYRVDLTVSQSAPSGTPAGNTAAFVHVNNVPLAAIAGPAADNVGIPVNFSGTGSSDPDNQPLTYNWVLVSRPERSSRTLVPTGTDNATLTPDIPGTYEIGLRVDDGLDNSTLVTRTFTANPGMASPSSGGGGCSIGYGNGEEDALSALAALLLLLSPLGILSGRRREYRLPSHGRRSKSDSTR